MAKKRLLSQEEAGEAVQKMLRQLNLNAQEIGSRASGNERVQKFCRELCELSVSLLEWGCYNGTIQIWASFTPSMLDYETSDEGYGEAGDHVES